MKTKKLFALILALIMVLSCLSFGAFAAETQVFDSFNLTVTGAVAGAAAEDISLSGFDTTYFRLDSVKLSGNNTAIPDNCLSYVFFTLSAAEGKTLSSTGDAYIKNTQNGTDIAPVYDGTLTVNGVALDPVYMDLALLDEQGKITIWYPVDLCAYLDAGTNATENIDQPYEVLLPANGAPVTKVQVSWALEKITATITGNRIWDTEKLEWVDDTSKTDGATVEDVEASFEFVNLSSVQIDAAVTFAVNTAANFTPVTPAFTDNGIANGDGVITLDTKANENVTTQHSGSIKVGISPNAADFLNKSGTGTYGTYTVTIVSCKAVESVSLSPEEAQIGVGSDTTLTATVLPADASDKTITWSSEDNTVATVCADGKVTGVAPGTAHITAATANGKRAVCTVTVVQQLSAPTLSLNYSELTITDTSGNATAFELWIDDAKVQDVTKAETTTVDLYTLSLGNGKHNVQCKATATGYVTSVLSSVSEYNNGYTMTFEIDENYQGSGNNYLLIATYADGTTDEFDVLEIDEEAVENNIVSLNREESYVIYEIGGNRFTHEFKNGIFYPSGDFTVIGTNSSECIDENSMITMANGELKAMKDIEVGDEVLSIDYDTMTLVARKVIYTSKDEESYANWNVPSYYLHTFSDGTVIKRAMRHRFYCLEENGYKHMDYWENGLHAYKLDGTNPTLVSTVIVQEPLHYARITLEGSNNYFANGLSTGDSECCPNKVTLNQKLEIAK